MTIQDKRARGLGSRGPYKATCPDAPIPEFIQLYDGRKFKVSELVKKQSDTRFYNLLVSTEPVSRTRKSTKVLKREHVNPRGKSSKYSDEERMWQCTSTIQEIADRYGYSTKVARAMKVYARQLMNFEEDCYIIDHTKKVDNQTITK